VPSAHELVRSFYDDLWNCWDDTLVDNILSPGFEFRGSLGTSTVGRDGWRSYRDAVRAGAADFHNHVVSVVAEDTCAAVRLLYSGTHTGPLLDLPATGRRFEYAGAGFFTVEDGLLASAWVLGDLAGLRDQLSDAPGAPPA
jgi:predicted ester cyclase